MKIEPGMRFGKLTVISKADGYKWNCLCDCGNATTPTEHNLLAGKSTSCGNCGRNYYRDMDDGVSVEIITTNGIPVYIDKIDEDKVRKYKWSVSVDKKGFATAVTPSGIKMHELIVPGIPSDMEIDHKDMNRLNNRRSNLRCVTHQQNQVNQGLQKNNTSGYAGVSFFPARGKYRARIKISGKDIHLGYYRTIEEAVQARNWAERCLFGPYGQADANIDAPDWIKETVIIKCLPYYEGAPWTAYFDFL